MVQDETSTTSSEGPSRDELENEAGAEIQDEAGTAIHEVGAVRVEVEPPQIVLTDDGRILETPKEKLACPFCQKEYKVWITKTKISL